MVAAEAMTIAVKIVSATLTMWPIVADL